jgi:hypothetical protein
MMNMHRYYAQLVGCKIVDFKFEQDECAYAGDKPFPVFTIEQDDGTRVILSLSMDEEGNGGGFGFIEKARKND